VYVTGAKKLFRRDTSMCEMWPRRIRSDGVAMGKSGGEHVGRSLRGRIQSRRDSLCGPVLSETAALPARRGYVSRAAYQQWNTSSQSLAERFTSHEGAPGMSMRGILASRSRTGVKVARMAGSRVPVRKHDLAASVGAPLGGPAGRAGTDSGCGLVIRSTRGAGTAVGWIRHNGVWPVGQHRSRFLRVHLPEPGAWDRRSLDP